MRCIRKGSLVLGNWLALAAAFAATPALAVDAGCAQWNASGRWTLIQTNDTAVSLTLEQKENGFSGQASFGHWVDDAFFLCNIGSCGKDYVGFSGPAVGTIKGNAFEATIYWNNNSIGVYNGEIGPQGLIVGTTFDKNNPRTTAQWHSDRVMACSAGVAAPPPTPPPPATPVVKALGRVKTDSAGPTMTICEAAASARARNSPAAPGLEKQCAAQPPKPAPPVLDEAWRSDHAARGAALAEQDPLATELRNAVAEGPARNGFDFGMAVAEGQTLPGPGKQAIHDALELDEQFGFELGVQFSLDRNANAGLAAKGAAIMIADPEVAAVRDAAGDSITREVHSGDQAVFYKLGYNIATGIFGDPALGANGNTAKGPGSAKIRDALAPGYEQSGFDDAMNYHLARDYRH